MKRRLSAIILAGCLALPGASSAQITDAEYTAARKQAYLKALTSLPDYDNPAYMDLLPATVFGVPRDTDLSGILWTLSEDDLRRDVDIQKALIPLRDFHPVTKTRWLAARMLKSPEENAAARAAGYKAPYREMKNINRTRTYCTAESVGAKAIAPLPDDLREELTPIWDYGAGERHKADPEKLDGVIPVAQEVSEGWLAGYKGALGLHYVPRDKSLDTVLGLEGSIHAIVDKEDSDSFLVLSTDEARNFQGRLCPGILQVTEVTETAPAVFKWKTLRRLPDRIQDVKQMENGDLFLSFGTACFFYASNRIKQDKYYFNPPIGLTPSGQIYDVCEKGATTRR